MTIHPRYCFAYAKPFNVVAPHDPSGRGWKMTADGQIELRDGNPIYIDANGQELALGADTVARLNGEAKTHREKAEALAADVKKFEGIDPEKARDALDKLSRIDQKKLIEAGEVEKVREEISKSFSEQISSLQKQVESLSGENVNLRVNHQFATSKFVGEKVAVPLPMFQNTFAKNFKVEDGKVVPYYDNGNKVYSKKKAGELADFDEALEIIIGESGFANDILKGANHSGSGNGGGGGNGGGNGKKRMTRDQFNAQFNPTQRMEMMTKGEVELVD